MVGNRVFGHSLILCMAAALLFAPWGTLYPANHPTEANADTTSAVPSGMRAVASGLSSGIRLDKTQPNQQSNQRGVLVHGLQGHIAIGKVRIDYWMIVLLLAMGSVVASLNLLSWTRLSSLVTFALFGMAAACSLVAIIHFTYHGEVGTGSVLAMTC
ncbi:MAG: hypothetical protein IT423_06850, partial [Pirellulaceae bacterium]|nr:hypothetical protein [Pirellulaceae bacterium]